MNIYFYSKGENWFKPLWDKKKLIQKIKCDQLYLRDIIVKMLNTVDSNFVKTFSDNVPTVRLGACVHGWENKSLKGEIMASIIIRSILLISSYLGSTVHVFHSLRKSNWESLLVDRMSRSKTMNSFDIGLIRSFSNLSPASVLLDWIKDPSEDWSFSLALLDHVKKICE